MELVFRVSAAAVFAVLAILLIRKSNPELSAATSIGAVVVIVLAGLRLGSGFQELRNLLRDSFGVSEVYLQPVLKCVAAALVTKLTADVCKDSAQTAAASAVELAGTLCAMGILMPLLMTMLKMVEEFL